MPRLLVKPLFWAFLLVLVWLFVITVSIANNPEQAKAQDLGRVSKSSSR